MRRADARAVHRGYRAAEQGREDAGEALAEQQREQEQAALKDSMAVSLGDLTIVGWLLVLVLVATEFWVVYSAGGGVLIGTGTAILLGMVFVGAKLGLESAGIRVVRE